MSEREREGFVRNGGTRRVRRIHAWQVQVGARRGVEGGRRRAAPPQRGAGERSAARARGSCCRWGAGGVTRSRKGAKYEGNERDPSPPCRRGMGDLLLPMLSTRLTSHEPMVLYVPGPGRRGLQSRRCYTGRPCLTPTGRLHQVAVRVATEVDKLCPHNPMQPNTPAVLPVCPSPVAGFCSWAQTPRLRRRSPHRSPTTLRTTRNLCAGI